MLKHLLIQNYALIDHLDIRFFHGFTAITGETGAGKSILMDALDLVLGKRADSQVLLNTEKKCIVEGTFDLPNDNIIAFFAENNLDEDDSIILRREIHPNGKSRAFINDTPVNLNVLKALGDMLVDIHAQHATTSLQDPAFQLSVIDRFAGLEELLGKYREKFFQIGRTRQILQGFLASEEEGRKTMDYHRFLLEELKSAEITEDEQTDLEEQLNVITHAEEIKSHLFRVLQLLSGEDNSVTDLLTEAESGLGRISGFHPGIAQALERLRTDLIDIKDLSRELAVIDQGIDFNAGQMAALQERLDLIYGLQHKHHVKSCQELILIRDDLETRLREYDSLEDQITELSRDIRILEEELKAMAEELSGKREKVFKSLAAKVVELLRHMGMPDARFEISKETLQSLNSHGQDKIEFYFNANKGHSLKPIADIASGGELARVMLGIKSLISGKKMLPTIIFDEIDNGLSGDIAGRVGDILSRTASGMQVIAITHLPQIAGKANHQYVVYKEVKNQVTYSNIRQLDQTGRLTELAKMIGGKDTTPASVAAAKELLSAPAGDSTLFENN